MIVFVGLKMLLCYFFYKGQRILVNVVLENIFSVNLVSVNKPLSRTLFIRLQGGQNVMLLKLCKNSESNNLRLSRFGFGNIKF